MRPPSSTSLIAALSFIAASPCLAAKPDLPPVPQDVPIYISNELPSNSLKGGSYAVPDSYYGIFKHHAANKALGALGMFGGIANGIKLRDAAKSQSGHTGLFDNNLADMLTNADASFLRGQDKPSSRIELQPAATLYFTTDQVFFTTCTVEATTYEKDRRRDHFRITVSWSPQYTLSDEHLPEKLRDGLGACMKSSAEIFALVQHYGNDGFQHASVELQGGKVANWYLLKPVYPERFISIDGEKIFEYGMPGAPRNPNLHFDEQK